MAKKCIVCNGMAEFFVKGTSDFYCKECAVEQFGDITYVVKIEEEARRLKEAVDNIMDEMEEAKQDIKQDARQKKILE